MSPTAYLEVFNATPYERIRMIKAGVKRSDAKRVLNDFASASELIAASLGVSWPAITKGDARDETLSINASERIVGIARLVGQAKAMALPAESFDAPGWIATWLLEPVGALGGRRPVDYLDTMEGRDLISNLLAQMQSGAYT